MRRRTSSAGLGDFFEGSFERFDRDKLIAREALCKFVIGCHVVFVQRLDKYKRSDTQRFSESLNGVERDICDAALGVRDNLA